MLHRSIVLMGGGREPIRGPRSSQLRGAGNSHIFFHRRILITLSKSCCLLGSGTGLISKLLTVSYKNSLHIFLRGEVILHPTASKFLCSFAERPDPIILFYTLQRTTHQPAHTTRHEFRSLSRAVPHSINVGKPLTQSWRCQLLPPPRQVPKYGPSHSAHALRRGHRGRSPGH